MTELCEPVLLAFSNDKWCKTHAKLASYCYPEQHWWIQTYTGQKFDPMNPDPSRIDIVDIAHALSMSCRYGGHVTQFYSVAEHSYHVSRAVDPELALYGLLHDAAEAYVSDIVRPVKKRMPEYQEVENKLMAAICAKFGLAGAQPAQVSDVDLRIVIDEKAAVMSPEPEPWTALDGLSPVGVTIRAWSPPAAEMYFLTRFNELMPC